MDANSEVRTANTTGEQPVRELSPRERSRFLHRDTPPHILTLVLIAGVGALNMNIFLPSLPSMATYFRVDYAIVQLAVSAYLAMTALLQIFAGPLSDRFGRRPILIGGMIIFTLATIAASMAETIETFLAARMVSAAVVTGFTLSRAIVRDMVPVEQAASMIGYVTMGMTIVPMIGPTMGGFLEESFGWQSVFYFTAGVGLMILLIAFFDLGETNENKTANMAEQFRAYPELLTSRRFWGFAFSALFASGTFFAFLGGAPYVAREHLGMSPSAMGVYFMFIAVGYMTGNFLSGRYATRFGIFNMMFSGAIVAGFGVAICLIYFYAGFANPLGFFAPLFFVGMGNGLTLPSANAGLVSVRPNLAGSASGLGGAIQIGGGAALSVIAGVLLDPATGPFPILWLMFIAALLGIICTHYTAVIDRQLKKQENTA